MTAPDHISEAELAALADGTLDDAARDALLRRVQATPALAGALDEQRSALAAVTALGETAAPEALRASVAAMAAAAEAEQRSAQPAATPAPPRRWWLSATRRPAALAGLGAFAAAAAAVIVIGVTGGSPAGPTVAQAATVALGANRAAAPLERHGGEELDVSVDGIVYPSWRDEYGWKAVGARHDVVGGKSIETVFYANGNGGRIGYAIASGGALAPSGGRKVTHEGVKFWLLRQGGADVVTWQRDGHTCILAARGVDTDVLLELAASHVE